jgi:CheY-like chemotaxis protein
VALILVADDDEKVCRWLRTVLELEGYRVIEAADGRQALRTIQRLSPDLVMLDVYSAGSGRIGHRSSSA